MTDLQAACLLIIVLWTLQLIAIVAVSDIIRSNRRG